jgi:hypothetical protein
MRHVAVLLITSYLSSILFIASFGRKSRIGKSLKPAALLSIYRLSALSAVNSPRREYSLNLQKAGGTFHHLNYLGRLSGFCVARSSLQFGLLRTLQGAVRCRITNLTPQEVSPNNCHWNRRRLRIRRHPFIALDRDNRTVSVVNLGTHWC